MKTNTIIWTVGELAHVRVGDSDLQCGDTHVAKVVIRTGNVYLANNMMFRNVAKDTWHRGHVAHGFTLHKTARHAHNANLHAK